MVCRIGISAWAQVGLSPIFSFLRTARHCPISTRNWRGPRAMSRIDMGLTTPETVAMVLAIVVLLIGLVFIRQVRQFT